MKGGLRILPKDERDFSFGGIYGLPKLSEIPDEFDVSEDIKILDQNGYDFCGAFSSVAVSRDQEEIDLDPFWQFSKMKELEGNYASWGTDLRNVGKSFSKFGSLPLRFAPYKGGEERDFLANWENYSTNLELLALPQKKSSYMFVKKRGKMDWFDAVRAVLWANRNKKQSVVAGVMWCWGWENDPIIDKIGEPMEGHAIKIFGVKKINGKLYLKIQNSYGEGMGNKGIFYISRQVFNEQEDFGAIVFNDMPKEKAQYYQENGISVKDNWLVQMCKTIKNFFFNFFRPKIGSTMRTLKVRVVANNSSWAESKLPEIRDFFLSKVNLDFSTTHTNFKDIVFNIDPYHKPLNTINQNWYDQMVTSQARDSDIVIFQVPTEDRQGLVTPIGLCVFSNIKPYARITLFCNEIDHAYIQGKDYGLTFDLYACHELSHALYWLLKKPDNTHEFFYSGNPKGVLADFYFPSELQLSLIQQILNKIAEILGLIEKEVEFIKDGQIDIKEEPKYKWDTPEEARHSCRVIMDEYNLTWNEKNLLCAVIMAESEFKPKITHKNINGTIDWGICMFNDGKNKEGVPYWIGENATFKSGQECLENPEKCVRVMIKNYRKGFLKYWTAFSNGSYRKYL